MMRTAKIRVVLWGLGAMGSGMAKMLLSKEGFQITGICDLHPARIGRRLSDVLAMSVPDDSDIFVQSEVHGLINRSRCDLVLLATDSFTKQAFPKLKYILEQGVDVISTAEEMSYPQAGEPILAQELDILAKSHGATVLGCGINPGMMMDLLVVMMTGVMADVQSIDVARVNSLSPFGPTVMEEQGVGLSTEDFAKKQATGHLAGHVGFRESAQMIADALGWKLSSFSQWMAPIVTHADRKSPYGEAKKNHVAGVDMNALAMVDGLPKIRLSHPQQIEPHVGGVETGDYIRIQGTPEVHLSIQPEIDGGIGTIAVCVNMIPHVLNAKPGLKTMLDLPVPRAIMGDVRAMVDEA
jgi:4-hydroxy-tetrahydrodipicolinate reductase